MALEQSFWASIVDIRVKISLDGFPHSDKLLRATLKVPFSIHFLYHASWRILILRNSVKNQAIRDPFAILQTNPDLWICYRFLERASSFGPFTPKKEKEKKRVLFDLRLVDCFVPILHENFAVGVRIVSWKYLNDVWLSSTEYD